MVNMGSEKILMCNVSLVFIFTPIQAGCGPRGGRGGGYNADG